MAQSTAKGGNSEAVVRADRSRDFGDVMERGGFLQMPSWRLNRCKSSRSPIPVQ